jgi:hypothetical protein
MSDCNMALNLKAYDIRYPGEFEVSESPRSVLAPWFPYGFYVNFSIQELECKDIHIMGTNPAGS